MTKAMAAAGLDIQVVDLDINGEFLVAGTPVPVGGVPGYLPRILAVPKTVTDIFIFAHGWRNTSKQGLSSATELYRAIGGEYAASSDRYPELRPFRPLYIAVRWPSMSLPLPLGYRRIRDRAHAMTTDGRASYVLAQLLGYLHERRTPPVHGPSSLQARGGQYLHCLGHSFGARFMGEAIMAAADPPTPPALGWPWKSSHPFGIDTFVAIQMAAPPDILAGRLQPLNGHAPLHGPLVSTFSRHDRANRIWHRLPERAAGVGAVGLRSVDATTIRLKPTSDAYTATDFASRIVNIDATRRFRRGRWLRFEGAHSDYLYPETAHLVLSLAALAR